MHKTSSGQCSYLLFQYSFYESRLVCSFSAGWSCEYVSVFWCLVCNLSNTSDIVSSGHPNLTRELKIRTQQSIFDEIRGVWIADEALSLVFDISSQSKQKLRSKRRNKILKIYANKYRVSKPPHGCDFLGFNFSWVWEVLLKLLSVCRWIRKDSGSIWMEAHYA